jgi:hypothetical protein
VRKSFLVRVRARSKHLKRVNVMVDRQTVVRRQKKSFTVRVRVAKLRHGKHRLTARASDRKGRAARRTVVFRVCA